MNEAGVRPFLLVETTYLSPSTLQFLSPLTTVFLKSISSPAWLLRTRSTNMGSNKVMFNSGTPAASIGSATCAEDLRQAVSEARHGVMKRAGKYGIINVNRVILADFSLRIQDWPHSKNGLQ